MQTVSMRKFIKDLYEHLYELIEQDPSGWSLNELNEYMLYLYDENVFNFMTYTNRQKVIIINIVLILFTERTNIR